MRKKDGVNAQKVAYEMLIKNGLHLKKPHGIPFCPWCNQQMNINSDHYECICGSKSPPIRFSTAESYSIHKLGATVQRSFKKLIHKNCVGVYCPWCYSSMRENSSIVSFIGITRNFKCAHCLSESPIVINDNYISDLEA